MQLVLKQVGSRDMDLQQGSLWHAVGTETGEQVPLVLCKGIFIPTGSHPCHHFGRQARLSLPLGNPPSTSFSPLVLGTVTQA